MENNGLEAIWQFIDGEFSLSDDFEYLNDPTIKPRRLEIHRTWSQIPHLED